MTGDRIWRISPFPGLRCLQRMADAARGAATMRGGWRSRERCRRSEAARLTAPRRPSTRRRTDDDSTAYPLVRPELLHRCGRRSVPAAAPGEGERGREQPPGFIATAAPTPSRRVAHAPMVALIFAPRSRRGSRLCHAHVRNPIQRTSTDDPAPNPTSVRKPLSHQFPVRSAHVIQ